MVDVKFDVYNARLGSYIKKLCPGQRCGRPNKLVMFLNYVTRLVFSFFFWVASIDQDFFDVLRALLFGCALATGLTGFAWAAAENINLVTTGWLLALELIYAVDVFIFLPLLGVGLRRVRLLALQAKKRGETSQELEDAINDRVPVVFGTLMVLTVPVMTWLAIYKPF